MDWDAVSGVAFLAIIIGCVVAVVYVSSLPPDIRYCEIYQMKAPFGEIVKGERGYFFIGSGVLYPTMEEVYIIKYMDGNQLFTITLNAEYNSIIVDGTLKLEIVDIPTGRNPNLWGGGEVRLHIPYLPNQTSVGTVYWEEGGQ